MKVISRQIVEENIDSDCYVCGKKIGKNYVKGIQQEEMIYRHEKCFTGSANWLKSDIAKKSQFYNLYKKVYGQNFLKSPLAEEKCEKHEK